MYKKKSELIVINKYKEMVGYICNRFGFDYDVIFSESRVRPIKNIRFVILQLLNTYEGFYPCHLVKLTGKDNSTILHSLNYSLIDNEFEEAARAGYTYYQEFKTNNIQLINDIVTKEKYDYWLMLYKSEKSRYDYKKYKERENQIIQRFG